MDYEGYKVMIRDCVLIAHETLKLHLDDEEVEQVIGEVQKILPETLSPPQCFLFGSAVRGIVAAAQIEGVEHEDELELNHIQTLTQVVDRRLANLAQGDLANESKMISRLVMETIHALSDIYNLEIDAKEVPIPDKEEQTYSKAKEYASKYPFQTGLCMN